MKIGDKARLADNVTLTNKYLLAQLTTLGCLTREGYLNDKGKSLLVNVCQITEAPVNENDEPNPKLNITHEDKVIIRINGVLVTIPKSYVNVAIES